MKFFMPVGFLAIRIPTAAALAFVLASLIALLMLAASPAQAAGWKPACNPLVPPPCTVQGDPIAAAITSLHHNYDPVVPTGNGGMATDVFGHPSLATMGGTRTSIPFNVGGAATTDCTGFRFMSMMGCTNGPSGPQKKPTCPDSAGDPINIATGDHYEEATDFTTRGADPLALTRSYNSDLNYVNSSASAYSGANTPYQSRFGYAWRSQYDRFIQDLSGLSTSSTQIDAIRGDGNPVHFVSHPASGMSAIGTGDRRLFSLHRSAPQCRPAPDNRRHLLVHPGRE